MWKETKVVKNVGYDNFDARFGAYATDEAEKNLFFILEIRKYY